MKILVITQYYSPEPGAPSNRLLSFVNAMVKRGHKVTVVCEFPNYPSGRLSPKDKWRLFRVEDSGSYKIVRTFVITFTRKNNIKRMLFYLSFAFSSFIAALMLNRHDVVFASSPPIFHTFTAMIAAKLKRSKFVLDIRDIWPDAALEVEAIHNERLIKYGSYLERKIYKNAKIIFTTTKGFKKHIDSRGGKGKTIVSYNGSFEEILSWNGDEESFRRSHGWFRKIVITYAGLIGLGQDLSRLLPEISKLSQDELLFVFVGNGPGKFELEKNVKDLKLENVMMFDLLSIDNVIPFLHCSDVLLVMLRETEFFKIVIPSKFFDYMAAGKPIVSNVDGELREIMEKNNTGIYFSIKESDSFVKSIETLINNPERRKLMGENGKKLVANSFLRSKLAAESVKVIEEISIS